jgi:glycosyltransferase involved in cell wall biosynthesis
MKISVMITTFNRCVELRRTLTKLFELDPRAGEILICADGCTDETVEMVRNEFPGCTLIENKPAQGSVFSRDRLLRLSQSDIVVSLDDDSYPIDRDFLSRLGEAFKSHVEAAVITFMELRGEDATPAGPAVDLSRGQYVAAYPNCAAAMRRSLYGGRAKFPLFFEHMYEEPDYALQCYALGFGVWFEPTLRVRHYLTASRRRPLSRHHLHARNELWSVCLRCPWPWLPFMLAYRVCRQLIFAVSQGFDWALREPVWWMMALAGWRNLVKNRHPVPSRLYRAWLRLNRKPICDKAELRRIMSESK